MLEFFNFYIDVNVHNSLQYLRSGEVSKSSLCPGVLPACDRCRAGGQLPAAGEAAQGGVLVDTECAADKDVTIQTKVFSEQETTGPMVTTQASSR